MVSSHYSVRHIFWMLDRLNSPSPLPPRLGHASVLYETRPDEPLQATQECGAEETDILGQFLSDHKKSVEDRDRYFNHESWGQNSKGNADRAKGVYPGVTKKG